MSSSRPAVHTHTDAGSRSSSTQRQSNVPAALWPSAPGSRPALVSTWKPLQIPISGPSGGDERAQLLADADGEIECQHPPGAERVGVAETAGHDGEPGTVEDRRILDEFGGQHDLCTGAGHLERGDDVAVAIRARAGDHDGGNPASSAPRPSGEGGRRGRRRRPAPTPPRSSVACRLDAHRSRGRRRPFRRRRRRGRPVRPRPRAVRSTR